MENEKIIAKVKALLAKAEGTNNINEQQVFFQKAQELIVKHQLSEQDMQQISNEEIMSCYSEYFTRTFSWHWQLAQVVAENHNCLTFRNNCYDEGRRMVFFGYKDAATIASLVFNSCLLALVKKSTSYRLGFVDGLRTRYADNWQTYGLVPVVPEDVVSAHKERKITLVKVAEQQITDAKEYRAGLLAGKNQLTKKIAPAANQTAGAILELGVSQQ